VVRDSNEKGKLLERVEQLTQAASESQLMLVQAAEGGEAAVSSLSQELEQVKSHKAALLVQVEEMHALNDATRVELLEAQGHTQVAQVCARPVLVALVSASLSGTGLCRPATHVSPCWVAVHRCRCMWMHVNA